MPAAKINVKVDHFPEHARAEGRDARPHLMTDSTTSTEGNQIPEDSVGISMETLHPSLLEVGAKFLDYAKAYRAGPGIELVAALGMIEEHGRDVYEEMLSEAYEDFEDDFFGRVMSITMSDASTWPVSHPAVDQWLHENVRNGGPEMEMLAVFHYRTPEAVLEVMSSITGRHLRENSGPQISGSRFNFPM